MFRFDNFVLKHGDTLFNTISYVLRVYIVYSLTNVSNSEPRDFSRTPQHSIRDVQCVPPFFMGIFGPCLLKYRYRSFSVALPARCEAPMNSGQGLTSLSILVVGSVYVAAPATVTAPICELGVSCSPLPFLQFRSTRDGIYSFSPYTRGGQDTVFTYRK